MGALHVWVDTKVRSAASLISWRILFHSGLLPR